MIAKSQGGLGKLLDISTFSITKRTPIYNSKLLSIIRSHYTTLSNFAGIKSLTSNIHQISTIHLVAW